jgi:hypothetical protein
MFLPPFFCHPLREYHADSDSGDGTDGSHAARISFRSVKSMKSVVQFLSLRLAALAIWGKELPKDGESSRGPTTIVLFYAYSSISRGL